MKPPKYQYQALPGDGGSHIRIATIHPAARPDDDIHVSLRVEEFRVMDDSSPSDYLDKIPYYEAMSYCWGPQGDAGNIFMWNDISWPFSSECDPCDGKEGWLPARANLLSALRHIRYENKPRDMWIDAICIDQDDVDQKGPQVALMGKLYSRAASVLVWLGPAADGSDRAMELLQDWGTQWDFSIWTGHQPVANLPMTDRNAPFDCRGADSLAVYHLFCRDWFERLWVRQEIGLAATAVARVQCGSTVMLWSVFRNGWGALHNKHTADEDADFKARLENRLDRLYGLLSQAPVIWLTWVRDTFADAQCFDARDRIYAVRSLLADDEVKRAIKPDYTMTTIEVYHHATMAFLRNDSDGDLGILEDCSLHPDWQGPSWVPNWSHSIYTITALGKKRASCNLLPRSRVWELLASSVLRIRGVLVDDVAYVYSLPSLGDIRKMLADDPRRMEDSYPGGGTVLDAYARALCDDRFTHNDLSARGGRRPRIETVRDQLVQLLQRGEAEAEAETAAWAWMRKMLTGRILLRTASGLVGLAENGAWCFQPGDEIYAVFGCKHLLVLRPLRRGDGNESTRNYHLRGKCHIEGANFGERVLGPLPSYIRPVLAELMMPDGKRLNWVFQDTRTSEVVREDPRLESLGFDMTEYREALKKENLPWLRVDQDSLEERLVARGVQVQSLDLF